MGGMEEWIYSIWTDAREVEERGGREVYLKPWVYLDLQCCVVLRGITKVSYNVPKFAKITYTYSWTYLLLPGALTASFVR